MRLALPLTLCSHQAVTANSLLEPTRTSTLVRSAQRCVGLIVRFRAAAVSAMGGRSGRALMSAIGQKRTLKLTETLASHFNRRRNWLRQRKPISRKLAIMRSRPSTKRGWVLRIGQ